MSSNNFPDWFLLINGWMKLGNAGITLPFLAGALALKSGNSSVTLDDLTALIESIKSQPVLGYYVGVSHCPDIRTLVLSVYKLPGSMQRKCEFQSEANKPSLAFSPSAMSEFGGLGCKTPQGCVDKLLNDALPHIQSGNYSRNFNTATGKFDYMPFLPKDIKFISGAIGPLPPLAEYS